MMRGVYKADALFSKR